MHIQISKKHFLKYLDNILKAIDYSSPLFSLQGILFSVKENVINLTSSNGNLSIKEEIPVNSNFRVIEPGTILVTARFLNEIIKKQDDLIELIVVNKQLIIKSNSQVAHLNLLNVEDYPVINFDNFGSKELQIDVDLLRKIIKNVSFAAAKLDKRVILNGINIFAQGGFLTSVATNTTRVAYFAQEINSDIEFNFTILVKNLKDFIPNNAKGVITVSVNDSKIFTSFESTKIVSKLIDGVFPEVKKFIPSDDEFKHEIIIESREILDLIDKALVMSSESYRVVKLSVSDEGLKLESKSEEIGDIRVVTSNFKYKGEALSIPFNATFLKEAVACFEKEISISFVDKQRAFVVRGNFEPRMIQLILPHRSY